MFKITFKEITINSDKLRYAIGMSGYDDGMEWSENEKGQHSATFREHNINGNWIDDVMNLAEGEVAVTIEIEE